MKHTENVSILARSAITDLTNPIRDVKREQAKYWKRDYIVPRIDAIKNPTHKMFFTTLWYTGLRVSEVINIRLRDIDFQNYIVTVRWQKNKRWKDRNIPLHPQLKELLQLYTASYTLETLLFDFSRQRAHQLSITNFNGSCHRFRHSFAANWLFCGGDVNTLSRMLGHTNITTTISAYFDLVPQDVGQELIKVVFR